MLAFCIAAAVLAACGVNQDEPAETVLRRAESATANVRSYRYRAVVTVADREVHRIEGAWLAPDRRMFVSYVNGEPPFEWVTAGHDLCFRSGNEDWRVGETGNPLVARLLPEGLSDLAVEEALHRDMPVYKLTGWRNRPQPQYRDGTPTPSTGPIDHHTVIIDRANYRVLQVEVRSDKSPYDEFPDGTPVPSEAKFHTVTDYYDYGADIVIATPVLTPVPPPHTPTPQSQGEGYFVTGMANLVARSTVIVIVVAIGEGEKREYAGQTSDGSRHSGFSTLYGMYPVTVESYLKGTGPASFEYAQPERMTRHDTQPVVEDRHYVIPHSPPVAGKRYLLFLQPRGAVYAPTDAEPNRWLLEGRMAKPETASAAAAAAYPERPEASLRAEIAAAQP